MTARYGIYVGAPKQAMQPTDSYFERCFDEVIVRDVFVCNATPQGDTVEVVESLGWGTVLDPAGCRVYWGALGAGVTLSFGDAGHPTALDNAVNVAAANNGNLLSNVAIGDYYKPLWQLLGYADLPSAKAVSQQATLIFTLGGANTAGTNQRLVWILKGARRL